MEIERAEALATRWATPDDAPAVVAFGATHLHPTDDGRLNPRIANRLGAWTDGSHPLASVEDVIITNDPLSGKIVSAQALMRQPWRFEGVPCDAGQVEFVATHPDYRQRGLVRRQMEAMHERCEGRGWLMQVISGIPLFYRRFGYEPALENGGGRSGRRVDLEAVAKRAGNSRRVRPATFGDAPFLIDADTCARRRTVVYCERDPALWNYELAGRTSPNVFLTRVGVIETSAGVSVGYLACPETVCNGAVWVRRFELCDGVPWTIVVPSVVRHLLDDQGQAVQEVGSRLGRHHSDYELLPRSLSRRHDPVAWYICAPDIVAFLKRIAPALNARLSDSVASGCSATISPNLFGRGVLLVVERGAVSAEPWQPRNLVDGDAKFPRDLFLQLLFGYRSRVEFGHDAALLALGC